VARVVICTGAPGACFMAFVRLSCTTRMATFAVAGCIRLQSPIQWQLTFRPARLAGRQEASSLQAAPAVEAPITVVVADDQRLVRRGITLMLEAEPDIRVVAEAGNGRDALGLVSRHTPAVALFDIRMPEMDGVEATRQVIAHHPATKIVILTTFDADDYVYEALRAGVSGFLLKDAPADHLVAAVRGAAAGDALIDPAITRRLISRFATAARPASRRPDQFQALTAREIDVLRLVAAGLSNSEIAVSLIVEENTVKTHVSRIIMKLQLRDRVQAVVLAYESGFVSPESRT
jgi:DNA-binding NarL/FixJ family response regulator